MSKTLFSNDDIKARSDFYKTVFSNSQNFSYDTIKNLGIDRDSLKKLLPNQMEEDILLEPLVDNLIKTYATVSNKIGLEVPILSIKLNGADYIEDDAVLQELTATGDSIQFGRYSQYVAIAVSDTIYYSLKNKFVNSVEQLLKMAVETIELNNIFSLQPKVEHMSFYTCGIKEIQGSSIYEAIKVAILDLPKAIRRKAKIIINSNDYISLVEFLASKGISSIPFKQEIIIEENCINPIVGDISYLHINYDGNVRYDTQKSVKDGLYYFTLSFSSDIQIKLKSAFRIVSVK